jgi:hypothetical protein
MWKPPSRLLGDALNTKKESQKSTPTCSDYYKITQHILDNLEMSPDYEPPISVIQTNLERCNATYRVNVYTVDKKKIKKIWKSYWVEIKEQVMTFNPPLEIKNA